MTIRNWFHFFFYAMLIGGSTAGVVGLIVRWQDTFYPYIQSGQWGEFFAAFFWIIALGFTFSVVAQMGFFAYLTVHQFGVGIFRTLTLWNWVQLLLIGFVLFDLIAFRFAPNAQTAGQWALYIGLLAALIGAAVATAIAKARLTKKSALISALFFMIVVTTLEWLPVIMVRGANADRWLALLLFPILAVNAYQLLALPKYNAKSEEDRIRLEERKRARREAQGAAGNAGR